MKFLRTFLAALLAALVLLACVVAVVALKFDRKSPIEDHAWLHLDLYGELPAYDPPGGLTGLLAGDVTTLQSLLTDLEMAAHDDRIAGVILQLSASNNAGYGKLEGIRRGVERVRAAGKPVYAWADNIDLKILFAAAACDSFFCPPSAYVTITGLDRSLPHVHETLRKLGIDPEVSAIREYKAAAQVISRDDMTPEVRENSEWMLAEVMDVVAGAIERGRGIDRAGLESIMARAQLTGAQSADLGVVDRLLYWDEFVARCRPADDEDPRLVKGSRYAQENPADHGLGGKKKIAVVHAQGNIGGRHNGMNPLLGMMMGHETINAELQRALDDEDVVAIVLRIDSGGGDSLTSDLMGHKVEQVAREKPVIISMVDVAASGGYSMSYRGSWLVADSLTVTGSIGSITAKFDMSAFNEKIGFSTSHVSLGPNARWLDPGRPFTDEEFAMFQARHQESFDEWVRDIARARHLTVDRVNELGLGRVWTGRQAVGNGLIDEVGGFWEAVAAARRLAGVEDDTRTALWNLPEKQGLLASVLSGDGSAWAEAGRWLIHRSLKEDLRQIRTAGEPGRWHAVGPLYGN